MTLDADSVARLATELSTLGSLASQPVWGRASSSFDHLGAKLTDATLQAAVTYEAIVRPRVLRVIAKYPDAVTASAFANVLESDSPAIVIGVQNARKLGTIVDLTQLLIKEKVETCSDLRAWLSVPSTAAVLDAVHGVGPKTISFLKLLVGLEAIAVDIHIRRFAAAAGVTSGTSEEIEALLIAAGRQHFLSAEQVDQLVWRAMAVSAQTAKRRTAAT